MMNFNELDARTVRERVDMAQLWDAWITADDLRRHSFLGSIGWESRSGNEYLYSRKRGVVKSLGPRSPDTEQTYAAFHDGRTANKARLSTLAQEMDRQAAILRTLNAGRLPTMAARTLRAIRTHDKHALVRVIGTNALYGYEALAGVVFNSESTATSDIDILLDDRNRLRLLTEAKEQIGLTRLVQSRVDKTFQPRTKMDFRLTNDRGYMVEFLRPEPTPPYLVTPGSEPMEEGDIRPAPIAGLQWLVNAPAIDVIVLDERGFPVPMRCADPRHWAIHKLWLSRRDNRDAEKKIRDREQAEIMMKLIVERLPQFPMDESFLELLPGDLKESLRQAPQTDTSGPSW